MSESNSETKTKGDSSETVFKPKQKPRVAVQWWLIRMPGGMLKALSSSRVLDEKEAKEIYKKSFKFKRTEADDDPDTPWPVCKIVSENEIRQECPHLLRESQITQQRPGLIEV